MRLAEEIKAPARATREDVALESAMQAAMATGRPPDHKALLADVPALKVRDILRDGFEDYMAAYTAGRMVRDWFIGRYSFAVPTLQAIEAIAAHGPLIEVGAGSGLWSRILSHHVDVVATDVAAGENSYRQPVGTWHPVEQAGAVEAVRAHPGRTVLMVWPSYDQPWAGEAADAMHRGTVLCYVGEGASGCTGDERFHNLLEDRFERLSDVWLPQFDGIHDYLQIFRKV